MEKPMDNVFTKLAKARVLLQEQALKKSGRNKFSGYDYFELGDFLPSINKIFNDLGLCSVIEFKKDEATLLVINNDIPTDRIFFYCPIGEVALKGCHPIQNLGAQQTYTRRYLYLVALEIVEHDAIEPQTGATEPRHKNPTDQKTYEQKKDDIMAEIVAQDHHMKVYDKIKAADDLATGYLRSIKRIAETQTWKDWKGIKSLYESPEKAEAFFACLNLWVDSEIEKKTQEEIGIPKNE